MYGIPQKNTEQVRQVLFSFGVTPQAAGRWQSVLPLLLLNLLYPSEPKRWKYRAKLQSNDLPGERGQHPLQYK
jgi:hypothetical protein